MVVKKQIKQIVVFMPSFMGDSINCTPALQLLRQQYPDAVIHLVIRATANVFGRDPSLQCITDPRPQGKLTGIVQLIKTLRKLPLDACILMTNRFVDALIAVMAGIAVRIGYNLEWRGGLLTDALKLDRTRHYINRYAYLANVLCGNRFETMPRVAVQFSADNTFLAGQGRKIGWCILGKQKLSRHYPVTQTIAAIVELENRLNNHPGGSGEGCPSQYYLLGSLAEATEAGAVVKGGKAQGIDSIESLAGKTTINELVDVIAGLDLLITVDSAPLHIASATNTPIVALHSKGTSAFSVICPKGANMKIVHGQGRYIRDDDQVLDLTPQAIVAAAMQLLQ